MLLCHQRFIYDFKHTVNEDNDGNNQLTFLRQLNPALVDREAGPINRLELTE